MRRLLVFVIGLYFCVCASSQTLRIYDSVYNWEADMYAGLNNDGYQIDFGIAYFPVQYIGLKLSLGAAGEFRELEDMIGKSEYWDTDYAIRYKAIASLVLRSPELIPWKRQGGGFYLFVEPGFILSPGAPGSRFAKWSNWDVRSGINLQMDNVILSAGYEISDFSLYSGRPTNHNGLPDKVYYLTHTVFIGLAFKF